MKKLLVNMLFLISIIAGNCYAINTNEQFIASLNQQDSLDVDDTDAVFSFVLQRLDKEITVYPSEGYYYFNFYYRGDLIKGNLRFGTEHRDLGKISFVYFYVVAGQERSDYKTQHKVYSKSSDFELKKLAANSYQINFKNAVTKVKINQIESSPSFVNTLESYGLTLNIPMMDESGIIFYLSFHPKTNNFYFINDRSRYDESYYDYFDTLKIGVRSEFVYRLLGDDALVLVGVSMSNIFKNNYYDGPFDQLPDQQLAKIDFKSLLERMNPELVGKINNHGMFYDTPGSRVAISNYIEYEKLLVLESVAKCAENELFSCIQKAIDTVNWQTELDSLGQ